MNLRHVEWYYHKKDQESSGFRSKQRRAQSHCLVSSVKLTNRQTDVPLSKLVWEKYHPHDNHPRINKSVNNPLSALGRNIISTSQRGSYERELINRRLNILGEGFLDVGDSPWTPIQVTVTPASSDLLGPEISSDESPTEIEIPTQARRNFVSLRGLSSSLSQTIKPFRDSANSAHAKRSEYPDLKVSKEHPLFFLTDNTLIHTDIEAAISQVHAQTMAMENHQGLSSHKILSPWEYKSEDETTSCNKGTSPLQDGDPDAMISEIKVFQARNADRRETPKYPFETGLPKSRKSARPTIHNGLLRSHRLHDFSQPAVVSSTQQLLCLTPSKGGVITLGSQVELKHLMKPTESNKGSVHVKRFNENDSAKLKSQTTTVVTKATGAEKATAYRLKQRDTPSRPRTSGTQGQPFVLSNLHYRHTTQIRQPYRYSVTSPSILLQSSRSNVGTARPQTSDRNATAASISRLQLGRPTTYRLIENHMKWNRKSSAQSVDKENVDQVYPYQPSFNIPNPAAQARKMAPVLRVVPALPRAAIPVIIEKSPKSPIETEPVSQKKVRFSDQIGLPLVRNATPNYRRKHSYILRWLETAGRPAKSIGLPLALPMNCT